MPEFLEKHAYDMRPSSLPRFEHVQRFWDPSTGHWTAKILPGEYYITCNQESIATVLGSCVAACLRDTHTGVGGMNHFMLPEDKSGGTSDWSAADGSRSARFGTYAMERLLNDLFKLGARRERLELKLFGGGRILQSMDVGARNVAFVRSFAAIEGLHIAAEDMGGVVPRHVLYFPATGRVLLKHLRAVLDPMVAESEKKYRAALADHNDESDVQLFD